MKLSLLALLAAGLANFFLGSFPESYAAVLDSANHAKTGARFPSRLGAFERAGRVQHDADGSAAASYYAGRLIVLGVYYYKGNLPFAQEFASCRDDVKTVTPDAQLISDVPSSLHDQGRRATFSLRSKFMGGDDIKLISELLMFPHQDGFLKFRATYRADHTDRARAEVESFIRSLKLP
jgi:hypothetical protein